MARHRRAHRHPPGRSSACRMGTRRPRGPGSHGDATGDALARRTDHRPLERPVQPPRNGPGVAESPSAVLRGATIRPAVGRAVPQNPTARRLNCPPDVGMSVRRLLVGCPKPSRPRLRTRPRRLAADHQDLPSDGYEVDAVARGRSGTRFRRRCLGRPADGGVLLASLCYRPAAGLGTTACQPRPSPPSGSRRTGSARSARRRCRGSRSRPRSSRH